MRDRRPSSSKLRLLQGGAARETVDQRAFHAYLRALAKDPDAVLAWALAYEAAGDAERDAWVRLLETEAHDLPVACEAVVGPLLGVEDGTPRRARLAHLVRDVALTSVVISRKAARLEAPRADGRGAARTYALLLPLWLHFAELVVVSLDDEGRVAAAHRDPVVDARDPAAVLAEVLGPAGVEVDAVDAVDDLAHAVLASRRGGRPLPEALVRSGRLFDVDRKALAVAGGGGGRRGRASGLAG